MDINGSFSIVKDYPECCTGDDFVVHSIPPFRFQLRLIVCSGTSLVVLCVCWQPWLLCGTDSELLCKPLFKWGGVWAFESFCQSPLLPWRPLLLCTSVVKGQDLVLDGSQYSWKKANRARQMEKIPTFYIDPVGTHRPRQGTVQNISIALQQIISFIYYANNFSWNYWNSSFGNNKELMRSLANIVRQKCISLSKPTNEMWSQQHRL